ncbi:acyl-CoA thioesterase [Aestuariivirga sp.]|uniref:acyl-CoA thioesterase n=1 Tax=Aestuariivirga sp. TaxID=2650926 RepID=UPI0039E37678
MRISDAMRQRYGAPEGWNFGEERVVEWRDCDMLGHANHTASLLWCETLRVHYCEAIGLGTPSYDRPSTMIAQITARYLGQISFADHVLVCCRTLRIGRTSATVQYGVWTKGKQAFEAELVLVLFDQKSGTTVAYPDEVRRLVKELEPAAEV